ncbi:MAG: PrsW family intramembrane metalloprotease [Acidobacteriota bacterium]
MLILNVWIFLSSIVGPSLFWMVYYYLKDRYRPEPFVNLGSAYLFGLVAAFACLKSFDLLPYFGLRGYAFFFAERNHPLFLAYCLCVVGPIEELFKFLPYLFILMRFKKFDEKMDGIIYASVIALGFASFENFLYLPFLDRLTLFGRSIATPLTHSIFSSIWGYTAGVARLKKRSILKASVVGLFISALFHGLFDFLNFSSGWRVLSALLILLIWIWLIKLTAKLQQQERAKKVEI